MKLRSFVSSALLLILAAFVSPAHSTSILNFNNSTPPILGSTEFTVTLSGGDLDGVVATFFNPITDTGNPAFFTTSTFPLDFGIGSGSFTRFFDVRFSQTVAWTGGTTSFAPFVFDGVDIVGPGISESAFLANLTAFSSFSLPSPLTFLAGNTYSFAAVNTNTTDPRNTGGIGFPTWTFARSSLVSVPMPTTMALFVPGLIVLAFASWATRSSRSSLTPRRQLE